jgi:hypothetical protein
MPRRIHFSITAAVLGCIIFASASVSNAQTLVDLSAATQVQAELEAKQVDTSMLLNEMVNLERLTRMPVPPYRTYQFSSYDRRANLPNGKNWFGNSDGFGREPIPGVMGTIKKADKNGIGTYLLAEVDGPGALVRCWSAARHRMRAGMNGTIRMYLDGDSKPIFDGPANEFLINLYAAMAKQHGIDTAGLTAGFTQRDACYCPVTFAKSCRIEWTGKLNRVHFYHIELRKYRKDTVVKTFQPERFNMLRKEFKQVGGMLANASKIPLPRGVATAIEATVEPKETSELFKIEKLAGQISYLELKVDAKDIDRALRQAVLEIAFDGYSRPQVESPLGDFFAAAPGINPFVSLPMEVTPDGKMICRFPMPYSKSIVIRVKNASPEAIKITGKAVVGPYKWDDLSMHFYAQWRVNHNMFINARQGFDIPFVMVRGQGRFVGVSVHMMNPDNHSSGNWWGEGDEKIFVDDDGPKPSFFGTGSEDYFNYSWSEPHHYWHGYFAQPRCDGPNTRGFVSNNRFHILDDIPFYENIDFFMEMIHHQVTDGYSYARISYYYARPGSYSDQMPIFQEDLRVVKSPENWLPAKHAREKDATFLQAEDLVDVELVEADPFWAGGKRLAWTPSKEGDKLELKFDVPKKMNASLWFAASRTPDGGRCEFLLNGEPLSQLRGPHHDRGTSTLDLFSPYHKTSRVYKQGVTLQKGENTLTLIGRGKDKKSQGTKVGVDYFWYIPKK